MTDIKKTAQTLRKNIFDPNSPLYIPEGKGCFFPSHKNIIDAFRKFKEALFINVFAHKRMTAAEVDARAESLILEAAHMLVCEIQNTICLFTDNNEFCKCTEDPALAITADFVRELPHIQEILLTDIRAAYNGDPAASDPYQILLCYPGLRALSYQRMAHFLYKKGVRIIPRILTEYAHSKTGIDIHPGAQIGHSFFIDHGTGVVIGETTVIGDNVKVYQGVTLGAKSFPLDENGNPIKGIQRHPTVQDNVTIYANATVLGNITVGRGAVIPGNSWITADVPAKN
ncbi:serine O-acetyltransferase [Elusimicrobium simillimum]|uniref:serine O-acetyltransferase EpsC n=1 Tax=Elusimicrobium simillimum TaxID=3143438 RepID=UPI003C6FC06E